MKKFLGFLASFSALVGASVVFAFPTANFWHMPAAGNVPNPTPYDVTLVAGPNRAGAGGIYGTGGARDYGIKCSDCHVQTNNPNAGLIDATVTPVPPWQNVGGENGYLPGQQYVITVNLLNEHLGSDVGAPGNNNGFALAIEDASGNPAGVYVTDSGERSDACSATDPQVNSNTFTTVVWGDCHAVLFTGLYQPGGASTPNVGRLSWTFDWIAPAAGAGDLTVFYGVVDGDTAAESSLDDDVKEGTIPLREGS